MNKAWSLLDIKEFKDDQRTITGIATTPETDRQGDIVESKGIVFKNPLPLLWQHKSDQPVGHVTFGKVNASGMPFTAKIESIDEPGLLKDRLDLAWQSVKKQLVRGVSIGFRTLEDGAELMKDGGIRYTATEVMELSLVTIPANASATIQTIKAIDDALLVGSTGPEIFNLPDPESFRKSVVKHAALALEHKRQPVVHLKSPGASGQSITPKRQLMKTIRETIQAYENTRAAKAARMEEIMTDANEKGVTLDEAQSQEYDGIKQEVKAIDAHLVRLNEQEALNVTKAKPIEEIRGEVLPKVAPSGIISVGTRLAPGQKMARFALALKRAKGDLNNALSMTQNNKGWMDTSPEIATVLKAAVAAGDTTTSGWASELVYANNLANEFVEYLRPMTIIGKLNPRRIPFNSRWGTLTGGTTGYWVGQGKSIPMSRPTTGSATLGMTKAAGLCAIDDELARSSSPSAELIVRDELARAIVYLLDDTFINPNNGGIPNEKPASVTYGVTPITPSGTVAASIATDIPLVFAGAIAANVDIADYVWIMTPTTALRLSLMVTSLGQQQFPTIGINGGTWQGLPVIVSQTASISGSPQYGNIIVLVNPRDIFLADDDQVTIAISNEASIEMLDNPTNLSTGATAPTTVVSMFQTSTEAIRATRYVNWVKRRSTAAAFIQAAAYA